MYDRIGKNRMTETEKNMTDLEKKLADLEKCMTEMRILLIFLFSNKNQFFLLLFDEFY